MISGGAALLRPQSHQNEYVEPISGNKFSFAEIQGFVGDDAYVLYLGCCMALIVNTSAKQLGKPYNAQATAIARTFSVVNHDYDIHGNAMFMFTAQLGSGVH